MTCKSDKIIINQSGNLKKGIKDTIKVGSYNLENRSFKDNYLFFEKIYLELIAFYMNCDESATFDDFLEKCKDAAFVFNLGFRATSFKVRKHFDLFINEKDNKDDGKVITFESWSGRIVSSGIELPLNTYDVFKLKDVVGSNPELAAKYDWTPLNRVFRTHFVDQKVGDVLLSCAVYYLSKIDINKSKKISADLGAYKKHVSEKQCDDYENFVSELIKQQQLLPKVEKKK